MHTCGHLHIQLRIQYLKEVVQPRAFQEAPGLGNLFIGLVVEGISQLTGEKTRDRAIPRAVGSNRTKAFSTTKTRVRFSYNVQRKCQHY